MPEIDILRVMLLIGVGTADETLLKVGEDKVLWLVRGAAELLGTLLRLDGNIKLEDEPINELGVDVLDNVLGEVLPLAGVPLNEGLPTDAIIELEDKAPLGEGLPTDPIIELDNDGRDEAGICKLEAYVSLVDPSTAVELILDDILTEVEILGSSRIDDADATGLELRVEKE